MGNTCSPDTSAERQVKDTDAATVKEATASTKDGKPDLSQKDGKQLLDILNSYIAQNEDLKKKNAELQEEKEKAPEDPPEEKNKLLEELEKLRALTKQQGEELAKTKATLTEEESRIAKLKLQSELREQEARMMSDTSVASILIEGDLLKFTKGGKGKPSYKNVSVHLRAGEPTYLVTQPNKDAPKETVPVGWAPGNLVLVWADDEKSQSLTRAPIVELMEGAPAVGGKDYEGKVFSLKTAPNNKIIAFAATTAEDKDRWFNAIAGAMDGIRTETTDMHTVFETEREFTSRPLGFRVEEQVLETKDGKSSDVLMVTKVDPALSKDIQPGLVVTRCNEKEFEGLKYAEKLEAIKSAEFPFTLRFRGQEFLRAAKGPSGGTVRATHARDVSMQVLYPELFAELTKDGSMSREALLKHPLVQGNPEFKSWLENPDFKDLLQDLMSDPTKLRAFLTNKEL